MNKKKNTREKSNGKSTVRRFKYVIAKVKTLRHLPERFCVLLAWYTPNYEIRTQPSLRARL